MNNLKWRVAFIIPGDTQDDKKDKTQIIAAFNYPQDARDFIEKCLPKETQDRFIVIYK